MRRMGERREMGEGEEGLGAKQGKKKRGQMEERRERAKGEYKHIYGTLTLSSVCAKHVSFLFSSSPENNEVRAVTMPILSVSKLRQRAVRWLVQGPQLEGATATV